MQRKCCYLISFLMLFVSFAGAADGFQEMQFTVDGVTRTALVYAPPSAKTNATPLVFVFHGHGGNARQAARSFHIDREWARSDFSLHARPEHARPVD